MPSLQASIAPLSKALGLNPHALYERQLALVRAGLLPSQPGRGPGSGTLFSAETVAVLLISMLASDNISDCAETTRTLSAAKLTSHTVGREDALGGAKTFIAAVINSLSNDTVVGQIRLLRIHRRNFAAEVFLNSSEPWKEPSPGKIFTAYELQLAEDDVLFFQPKKDKQAAREGMARLAELSGPVLEKIRALLRNSSAKAAEQKNAALKPKSKGK
jgi:DNA-binding IscR family transcriptional regulator